MIYPTRRAVLLMAAGAPAAILLALLAPSLWITALAWIAAVVFLLGLDALLAPRPGAAAFALVSPASLAAVGGGAPAVLELVFAGRRPRRVEAALETNAKLTASPVRRSGPVQDGGARLSFDLAPVRRGEGLIDGAWARWTGPLGLLHLQARSTFERAIPITPDIHSVKAAVQALIARDAFFGQKAQRDRGDGSEFDSLREHQAGMDMRSVDWKQSARHGMLLSKEFATERNHPVMLVLDSGRLMGEPVGGAPKLDRALNAALALAYVSLKVGDRVGLSAFDARPRVTGKPLVGTTAFGMIQQQAARIDYSEAETNFVLGLAAANEALDRRALVVVFTDFADTTSAQLLIESTSRLLKRHLVLFALFADEELETLAGREPAEPDDVSRAVVADALLRERELSIAKLRHMGAEVIESPYERFGADLIDRYLLMKQRGRM